MNNRDFYELTSRFKSGRDFAKDGFVIRDNIMSFNGRVLAVRETGGRSITIYACSLHCDAILCLFGFNIKAFIYPDGEIEFKHMSLAIAKLTERRYND